MTRSHSESGSGSEVCGESDGCRRGRCDTRGVGQFQQRPNDALKLLLLRFLQASLPLVFRYRFEKRSSGRDAFQSSGSLAQAATPAAATKIALPHGGPPEHDPRG